MRIIEEKMLQAIKEHKNLKINNTTVCWTAPHMVLIELHDNIIARIDTAKKVIRVSSCGWHTVTTKSRLNAVLSLSNCSIYQENFCWRFQFVDGSDLPFHDDSKLNLIANL